MSVKMGDTGQQELRENAEEETKKTKKEEQNNRDLGGQAPKGNANGPLSVAEMWTRRRSGVKNNLLRKPNNRSGLVKANGPRIPEFRKEKGGDNLFSHYQSSKKRVGTWKNNGGEKKCPGAETVEGSMAFKFSQYNHYVPSGSVTHGYYVREKDAIA